MISEKKDFNKNNYLLKCLKLILFELQINLDNKVILDIGCSDLRNYSKYLSIESKEYVGIDIDSKMIEDGRKKLENKKSRLLVASAENLKFDNKFDIIIINDTLAYTDKHKVLDQSLKILNTGGIIISLFNNNITYNIHKIFNPRKSLVIEIMHSIIVIVNTIIYRISSFKVFPTTYNTIAELSTLIDNFNIGLKKVWLDKTQKLPYQVINFIIYK